MSETPFSIPEVDEILRINKLYDEAKGKFQALVDERCLAYLKQTKRTDIWWPTLYERFSFSWRSLIHYTEYGYEPDETLHIDMYISCDNEEQSFEMPLRWLTMTVDEVSAEAKRENDILAKEATQRTEALERAELKRLANKYPEVLK